MTTITYYQCDICQRNFSRKSDAEACESQGLPKKFPIGLMSADYNRGHPLAFALAKYHVDQHWLRDVRWACRDNGCDSLGEDHCGSANFYRPVPFDPQWTAFPCFDRLRGWLEGQGISPMVLVDGVCVSLASAMEISTKQLGERVP